MSLGKLVHSLQLLNADRIQFLSNCNSQTIRILIILCVVMLFICTLIVLFFSMKIGSKNRQIKELIIQHQNNATTIVMAQEQERKKIAQDIHDGLGAYLSSLKINIWIIKNDVQGKNIYVVNNMISAINKVSQEVKNFAYFLSSDTLEQYGVIIALEELIEITNNKNAVNIDFDHDGEFDHLSYDIQLCIFRVVQELVNNLLKHSKATKCSLSILSNGGVSIDYKDNGIGINVENLNHLKGKGFKNMQSRVKIINGTFQIFPSEEHSLVIGIKLPENLGSNYTES